MRRRRITVVAACHNASGCPDFALTVVEATQAEIDNGDHYDKARDQLLDNDYEPPFVFFDEDEMPAFLLPAVKKYLGDEQHA